jgi:hypothetical protein
MNRKIAVFASAAVLAGGAGIAVAANGDSAATTGSEPSMSRPGGPGGRFDLSALAEKLGVSESRLDEAMAAARPTDGQRPDASTMAEALAEELGLSADKVQAALEATMPSGGPGGTPPPDGATPPSGDASQS